MARFTRKAFLLYVGTLFAIMVVHKLAAQQSAVLPSDPIRIADFGLEAQVPSAIDLIGPQDSSAGRNRAALIHRLQCWIDGIESCSVADRNDPRIRELRRFLRLGSADLHGEVVVHFPDQTRIQVRLERAPDLDSLDWDQRVYESVVLQDTAQVPGIATVPSRPGDFKGFSYDGRPAIQAALERLRQRLEESAGPGRAAPVAGSADNRPAAMHGHLR